MEISAIMRQVMTRIRLREDYFSKVGEFRVEHETKKRKIALKLSDDENKKEKVEKSDQTPIEKKSEEAKAKVKSTEQEPEVAESTDFESEIKENATRDQLTEKALAENVDYRGFKLDFNA